MKVKNIITKTALFLLCAAFGLTGLGFFCPNSVSYAQEAQGAQEAEAASPEIGELWNGETFDGQNLEMLLKYITGSAATTLSNFSGTTTTAESMNAFEVLEKKVGQSVVVTLGGVKWTAVYLSKDKTGKDILTLWLEETSSSTWSDGQNDGTAVDEDPANMYGSCYLRAVALNNGGEYASNGELVAVEQDEEHLFAPFTIDKEEIDLSDFIVTPEAVSWQENGQKTTENTVWSHNGSNENWSDKVSNVGFYQTNENGVQYNYNYCKKERNGAWKNDKLWLPSLSEVGYEEGMGIWKVSNQQRVAKDFTWLRTAAWQNSQQAVAFYNSGNGGVGAVMKDVGEEHLLRPALHLNLTSAIRSARGLDPFNFGQFPLWTLYLAGGVLLIGIVLLITLLLIKKKNKKKDK